MSNNNTIYKFYMLVNWRELIDTAKKSKFFDKESINVISVGSSPSKGVYDLLKTYEITRKYSSMKIDDIKKGKTDSNCIVEFKITNSIQVNYVNKKIYSREITKIQEINNLSEVKNFILTHQNDSDYTHFIFNDQFDLYLIFNKNHSLYREIKERFITFMPSSESLYSYKNIIAAFPAPENRRHLIKGSIDTKDIEFNSCNYEHILINDGIKESYFTNNKIANVLIYNNEIWKTLYSLINNINNQEEKIRIFKDLLISGKFNRNDFYVGNINNTIFSIYSEALGLTTENIADILISIKETFKKYKTNRPMTRVFELFASTTKNQTELIGNKIPTANSCGYCRIISDKNLNKLYEEFAKESSYSYYFEELLANNDKNIFDLTKIDKNKYIKMKSVSDYNELLDIETDKRVNSLLGQFTDVGTYAEYLYPAVILLTTSLTKEELEVNKNTIANSLLSKITASSSQVMARPLNEIIKEEQEENLKIVCDELAKIIENYKSLQSARAKIRIMSKNGKTKYQDRAKGKRTIYSIMLESITDLNSKRLNRILVEESI